jgi:hypothetical protein
MTTTESQDPSEWSEADMANRALEALRERFPTFAADLSAVRYVGESKVMETGEPVAMFSTSNKVAARLLMMGNECHLFLKSLMEKRVMGWVAKTPPPLPGQA